MKNYETPVLEEDLIELEDIIATSALGKVNGDVSQGWGNEGDFF